MNEHQARNFVYRNARPLELARWKYLFEGGSREEVLTALLHIKMTTAALAMLWSLIAGIRILRQSRHGPLRKSYEKLDLRKKIIQLFRESFNIYHPERILTAIPGLIPLPPTTTLLMHRGGSMRLMLKDLIIQPPV